MSGETIFITTGKPIPEASLLRLGGALGDAFPRHRDAVGVADLLALGRGERGAARRLDGVEELANLGLVFAHGGLSLGSWNGNGRRSVR